MPYWTQLSQCWKDSEQWNTTIQAYLNTAEVPLRACPVPSPSKTVVFSWCTRSIGTQNIEDMCVYFICMSSPKVIFLLLQQVFLDSVFVRGMWEHELGAEILGNLLLVLAFLG